ncbi:hypothetical protein [Niveibacterium sp.]|uniref:hypothetical protein n=1 Tax=Niveibacterium sp. TaxID=2017444 RepID=UPI0035B436C5
MADQNDTSNEREFFTLAYAFDTLAQAARDHAPEAFERSADQLDMVPAALMRGVAYLSYLLSNVPDDERDTTQHHLAHSVMSELVRADFRLSRSAD